jgi:hypothetical protein
VTGWYLLLWAVIAFRELGDLRREENWRGMVAWIGVAALGLALWWVYCCTQWRLAEWLLHW